MAPTTEITKCFIVLTNTAREAIKEHFTDEHAFFNLQQNFYVYIEKLSIEDTSLSLTLYFDNKRNKKLAKKFDERVVILDCVFDLQNGLVAKSFRTRGKNTPVKTNRRIGMAIHFAPSRINGHNYPKQFIEAIAKLPVAQEKYDYVNKRISSWEGYLKVLYKNANIEDIDAQLTGVQYNKDYTEATLKLAQLIDKQWKQLKGLNLYTKGIHHEIGEVTKVHPSKQTVDIQLNAHISKLAKQNIFDFDSPNITFSNASTKSQLNRLLKGFERLKEGLSANPNLENFLFEDKPVVEKRKPKGNIEFNNNLNDYQREAVIGAIEAEDLYVIQGPPGTGKTTVISEICFQNVKMGQKTLIASQSNLAVDNALDRLLLNKDIRILRYGRTDSIEEEGKKFIEENVAQHWRNQTYDLMEKEISEHPNKETILRDAISKEQQKIEELQSKIQQIEKEIEAKKEAESKLQEHYKTISELKKKIAALNKEREKTEKTIATLEKSAIERQEKIAEHVENHPNTAFNHYQSKIDEKEKAIKDLEHQMRYLQLQEKIENAHNDIEELAKEIEQASPFSQPFEELKSIKKVGELKTFMKEQGIQSNFLIEQLFIKMDMLYEEILKLHNAKPLADRIEKAIQYSKQTLQIHVEILPLPEDHTYTIEEVGIFLNKLAHAFKERKINPINGIRSIQGLHFRRQFIEQKLEEYQAKIDETKSTFDSLKDETEKVLKEKEAAHREKIQELRNRQAEIEQKIENYKEELSTLVIDNPDKLPSINDILGQIIQLTTEIEEHKKDQNEAKQDDGEIDKIRNELAQITKELEFGKSRLEEQTREHKALNKQGIELEKEAARLQDITKQNPEQALENTKEQIAKSQATIDKIHKQIDLLPVAKDIQKEWFTLLQKATDSDLDEIRKLYVKHANVIGTTCVASANKEFMENYPDFDCVIIDEVSKATPPELLLPMLKGKKIILVGDHHQLPPLIGDDTFEETLEEVLKESDTFEEKRELEKLLEESLFERLYNNLPSTNKKMLGIQYRMHENIMKTIVPFYDNGKDSLHCGLANSDEIRDHKLTGQFIHRDKHLYWFDLPNKPDYFEERKKEGASLYNESELAQIRLLLIDLNEACEKAKHDGLMEQEALKSVGVISFYREQVNRINRLIDELNLQHLHLRTGSVDKFQGMEMDVIILSMVRNNNYGEIGFAKDYRRLNVALSRARELLMIVGSAEMFTTKPKNPTTREMYERLLNIVKELQGHQEISKVTTWS